MISRPYFPIVYVRGYAMTQTEVEETVADPYMGLNLGSTKLRQRWTGSIDRFIFESPLLRLMKEQGYGDVYSNGAEIEMGELVPERSVWIYRYYESASRDLGSGQRMEIEDYASGLHNFIEQIRDRVCGLASDPAAQAERNAFSVYLVAHSMGGLIVRSYLQNHCRKNKIKPPVDKVFTYATPHGGIDLRFIGNVPGFLTANDMDNFNETRMRKYLNLAKEKSVQSLDGAFDPNRFFCLVGTNYRDYDAALGLSRHAVGPMSDGLVQIKNATVEGAPRAFVNRSHSGHYGIVNSEEGYQNLTRFLFGDVRVDVLFQADNINLPPDVYRAVVEEGKKVNASYHIEVIGRVRGARWDLHRRTVDETSAVFADYPRIKQSKETPIQLMTVFLMKTQRVVKQRKSMGFSIDLGVVVPDYELDGSWFTKHHYDGGYLFRDKINLEVTFDDTGAPKIRFGLDSSTPNRATRMAETSEGANGAFECRIPIEQNTRPGLSGLLILRASSWE